MGMILPENFLRTTFSPDSTPPVQEVTWVRSYNHRIQ